MRASFVAKALAEGLHFVAGAILKRSTNPIVSNIKIEAREGSLVLTGTDRDQQHAAVVATTECEPGAVTVTVPGERLADLISKLPTTAQVSLKQETGHVVVSSGRGRWRLPFLPPDFPVLEPPGDGAAGLTLSRAEVRRVVKRTLHAVSDDPQRYYLAGVCFEQQAGQLAVVATNGHRLARTLVDSGQDLRIPPRSIVPTRAIETLQEIAAHGDVDIRIDSRKISFASGAWTAVSKLIDATFPDYERIIPEPSKTCVEVATADLLAAAERHVAASAEKLPGIGLSWANGTLRTCLSRAEDSAVEELAAKSAGKGRIALSARYLANALAAFSTKTITIDHAGKNAMVRFTSADEPATIIVIAPLTWWAAPIVDDQPQPPARVSRETAPLSTAADSLDIPEFLRRPLP